MILILPITNIFNKICLLLLAEYRYLPILFIYCHNVLNFEGLPYDVIVTSKCRHTKTDDTYLGINGKKMSMVI